MDIIQNINKNVEGIINGTIPISVNVFNQSDTPVDVYSNAALAANETIMSLGQSMAGVNQLSIYAYNTGASTSVTVNIYSSPDDDVDNIALLQPFTLNNTTGKSGTVPVSVVPRYLFIQAINNTATATTYTVKFSKK